MNPNMVRSAKGHRVGKLIGFAPVLQGHKMVDLEEARLTALLATPTVTI